MASTLRSLASAVILGTVLSLPLPAADTFTFRKIIAAGDPFPQLPDTVALPADATTTNPGSVTIDRTGQVTLLPSGHGGSFTTLATWTPGAGITPLLTRTSPVPPTVPVPCTRADLDCGPPRVSAIGPFVADPDGRRFVDFLAAETRANTNFFGATHRYLIAINRDTASPEVLAPLDEPVAARAISNFLGFAPLRDAAVTHNLDNSITLRNAGSVSLLASDGDPAPGLAAGTTYHPNPFAYFFNTHGETAFTATLRSDDTTTGSALLTNDSNGTLHTVASTGEFHPTLPELAVAGRWESFDTFPSLNNRSDLLFTAYVTDPGGGTQPAHSLWLTSITDPESPQLLAVTGRPTEIPGLGSTTFTFFQKPLISPEGTPFFVGHYPSTVAVNGSPLETTKSSVFKIDPVTLDVTLVFGEAESRWGAGNPVPGVPDSRLQTINTIVANGSDRLAILATYYDAGNTLKKTILAQDPRAQLAMLAFEGKAVDITLENDTNFTAEIRTLNLPITQANDTGAYNGEDGRPSPFSDSGRLLLNLQLDLAFTDPPQSRVAHLVSVDFTTDGNPIGNLYVWNGAAGTSDWHTITPDGTTNWADLNGTPWPSVPGLRGNERVQIEGAEVTLRNNAAISGIIASGGGLTVTGGASLNLSSLFYSSIENLELSVGSTITTNALLKVFGAESRWEGGTIRTTGVNGLVSVPENERFFLTGFNSDRYLDGLMEIAGRFDLLDRNAILTLAPASAITVRPGGEVHQASHVYLEGPGSITVSGLWRMRHDATLDGDPDTSTSFLIRRDGSLFAGENEPSFNEIGSGLTTGIEGSLSTINQLTFSGPVVIALPQDSSAPSIDIYGPDLFFSGSLIFRNRVELRGHATVYRSGKLVLELEDDHQLTSSDTDSRPRLTVISDFEWRRGNTSGIDLAILSEMATISGDGITHRGSLEVGNTLDNTRQSEAAHLTISGANTHLGSDASHSLQVGPHSLLEIDAPTFVDTGKFLIGSDAVLIQPSDLTSAADIENRGTHYVGGRCRITAPATTYIAGHTDDFFRESSPTTLVGHSPSAVIEAPVFKAGRCTINAPADTSLEFWSANHLRFDVIPGRTDPFLANAELNFRTPPLDIAPSGAVHFSDIEGNSHQLSKVSEDLTLRGDGENNATLNNLPVTTADLELAGSITLDNYSLVVGQGASLVNKGRLRLDGSSITVDAGGTFRSLTGSKIDGNGSINAPWTINAGTVTPFAGDSPVGMVTVNGTLTLNPGSKLNATITRDANDTIIVNGTAELGGTVNPSTSGVLSSDLKARDAVILTATSIDGRFDKATRGDTPLDLRPDLGYSPTRAILSFIDADAPPTYGLRLDLEFSDAEIADPSISGPGADPDSDGLPNFAEHVHGTSLTGPSGNPVRIEPYSAMPGSYILGFPVVDTLTDAQITIESKPAAGTWTADSLQEMDPIPLGGDLSYRRYLLTPDSAVPAKLYRLRFDQQ